MAWNRWKGNISEWKRLRKAFILSCSGIIDVDGAGAGAGADNDDDDYPGYPA